MEDYYLVPTPEQAQALTDMKSERPVVMLNFLRFHPEGGREAYARYLTDAAPYLERVGAKLPFLGDVVATMIGPEEWDEVLLMEYPSVQSLVELSTFPDYPASARTNALLDSRLYCVRPKSDDTKDDAANH